MDVVLCSLCRFGIFVVVESFVGESLLCNISCGIFCCGIFVVESLLLNLYCGIFVVESSLLHSCCGIFVAEY